MATFQPYVKPAYYKRVKDTGEPIYIRIIESRQSAFFPTGIRIRKEDWSFKKCLVKDSHPDSKFLNALLRKECERGRRIDLTERLKDRRPTAHQLSRLMDLNSGSPGDFDNYTDKLVSEIKLENPGLAQRYRLAHKFLKKYHKDDISFAQLDIDFIKGFDRFLKLSKTEAGKPLALNYLGKIHDYFRTIINRAKNSGHLQENPYTRFTIKREYVEVEYLTKEEIRKVASVILSKDLSMTRDFFLLLYYLCGMRPNELLIAKKTDLQMEGETLVLKQHISKLPSQMRKTKYSIVVPQAREIIERYKDSPGVHLIPYLDRYEKNSAHTLINDNLKEIAREAGVREFTAKFARKSFITHLSLNNVPSSRIAELVGHTSSKITERSYIGTDLNHQYQALNEAFR